jgi:hypothetical protein
LKTNETLQFLASAENDVLYLVTQANSSGTIWTWDATQTCTLTQLATVKNSISGIAVGPVPTATISQDLTATVQNPTPTTFMFNSNAFQIVGTGCTTQPTVTEYPISPATVKGMISLAGSSLPDGATPTTNLGEGGYSAAYVAKFDTCGSVFTDGAIVNSIYGLFDNLIANNTRILRCDGSTHEPLLDAGTTTCQAATTIGEYPLGGIIPDDLGTTIKTLSNSTFVLVNAKPTTNESAIFCPYQSPLVNTTDPKKAAVFSAGTKNTLSVKFKLAAASGSCQNGPYITDASALISVAMLTGDVKTFHTIPIASTSVGLADAQPLYNSGNQQYQFTLSLNGYAPGLYSLNTTLLTDNTFDSQNISAQTIVFRIK